MKLLVTTQEAIQISTAYGDTTDIYAIAELEKAWKSTRFLGMQTDPTFDRFCMEAAIFTMGYIQGKREERQRRHKNTI